MMDYLIIINNEDKIDIVQANTWEFNDYNFFPDEDGDHIYFTDLNNAKNWVLENVKEDLISPRLTNSIVSTVRSKYLK